MINEDFSQRSKLQDVGTMQRLLLLLDRFDTTKNYPFGWSCKAIK